MPHGEEIYSFTLYSILPTTRQQKLFSTHFDYHSIDHNLLKLDILGHDDPTMIRMLQDITGVDPTTLRFRWMIRSPVLFNGLEALDISP